MSAPVLSSYTDAHRHAVVITLSGAVTDASSASSMETTLLSLPVGYGLVVDLSDVTSFAPPALDGLRRLARSATTAGQMLVFVCSSLERRTELVLADLDSLAPVVHAIEQALPLVRSVA